MPEKVNADKIIGELGSEFKLVGSSRVHSWYAWAIVGIVLGMAIMLVYIANRSLQVTTPRAADGETTTNPPPAAPPPASAPKTIDQAIAEAKAAVIALCKAAEDAANAAKKATDDAVAAFGTSGYPAALKVANAAVSASLDARKKCTEAQSTLNYLQYLKDNGWTTAPISTSIATKTPNGIEPSPTPTPLPPPK